MDDSFVFDPAHPTIGTRLDDGEPATSIALPMLRAAPVVVGRLAALERELVALGVALHHSRPHHPQTCGKVERLHQTLKNGSPGSPRPGATTGERPEPRLPAPSPRV